MSLASSGGWYKAEDLEDSNGTFEPVTWFKVQGTSKCAVNELPQVVGSPKFFLITCSSFRSLTFDFLLIFVKMMREEFFFSMELSL